MTREEKYKMVEELTEKLSQYPHFYITDASGMTVGQVNKLRKLCYHKGVEYTVFKNSLIKKALANLATDYSPFDEKVLKGFSGIMFSENGKTPAQLIKDFRKEVAEKPRFKGASINSSLFIGEENLEVLINLKSREELIGDIIGILQSPAKNVISGLTSGGGKLAGILKTLSEKPE